MKLTPKQVMAKARAAKRRRPSPRKDSMQTLHDEVDAGYRLFWARRGGLRGGVPHLILSIYWP